MVTKALLLNIKAGLGHGETSIFPIVIFKVKEGVNYHPEDPNYDLYKLSIEVTAKRLFPNFLFLDSPFNLQYYKPGHPETEVACMGCVQYDELVTYKINNEIHTVPIGEMYKKFSSIYPVIENGLSKYINTENKVQIYDSVNGFVNCKKIIMNPNMNNWVKITFPDRTFICTDDHPLPVLKESSYIRTFVKDIKVGDIIPRSIGISAINPFLTRLNTDNIDNIIKTIPVNSYRDMVVMKIEPIQANEKLAYSYDVETESDLFEVSGIISHNCRTRVMGNVYDPEKEISYSRGNLSFTTINLPMLALDAIQIDSDSIDVIEKEFYNSLDKYLELCKKQLLERFEIQCKRKVKNMPFLMGQGVWLDSDKLGPDDEVREVLKHGTLAIGFVGLAEALVALYGHHHGEGKEYWDKGYAIIKHMREFTDRISNELHLNFGVIGTPAENYSGAALRKCKAKYGVVKGVTDRDYFTNSSHIPVYYPITAYEKIKLEAPFHELCNGGHIAYIELDGDTTRNVQVIDKIVRCMHDQGIGYGAINHPVDRDPVCGYTGVINDECPYCHRTEKEHERFERIRRITGYLTGTLDSWGDAKRAEEKDRVKHGVADKKEEEK